MSDEDGVMKGVEVKALNWLGAGEDEDLRKLSWFFKTSVFCASGVEGWDRL